jgi:hypothetical protein
MTDVAQGAAGRKPSRSSSSAAPYPSPPDRIDALARRVARLGYGARDAETFLMQREGLATELHALAREMRQ